MYHRVQWSHTDYVIMHNDSTKLTFTREEADAIVNMLNRKIQHSARDRRTALRNMARNMNVPKKEY